MTWVRTDQRMEDLMRVVAGWHDGLNTDQVYLMVGGRILPHDSWASLAFLGVRKGCTVRVQAGSGVEVEKEACWGIWRVDVLQSYMSCWSTRKACCRYGAPLSYKP